MAAEIRDLEDQLYEYDHQYQLLEQETETLRQQNLTLKSSAAAGSTGGNTTKRSLLSPAGPSNNSSPNYYSPLEFQPRPQNAPITPEPILESQPRPLQPNSILESGGESSRLNPGVRTPNSSSAEELPAPESSPKDPGGSASGPAVPPDNAPHRLPGQSSAPDLPDFGGSDGQGPSTQLNTPAFPQSQGGSNSPSETPPNTKRGIDEENLEELMPPTIDPGVPSPPPLPAVTLREDGTPVPLEDDLEMNLTRIEIPRQKVPAKLASDKSLTQATLQVATEKVTDMRVVELAFHPTLSRAIDMDDRPDDDGMYLVLQPKNERGQMVPIVANLIIFALDPARDEEHAKIGRWEYTAAELRDKLQPIGSEQGIHLRLPWNGPDPAADRVIVFALLKFDNGKQVMGEKEIYISSDGNHKTVWAPRASRPIPHAGEATSADIAMEPAVAQAGFMATSPNPKAINRADSPHTNPVVRPANGNYQRQPPPLPR